jgi:hypothetical protein
MLDLFEKVEIKNESRLNGEDLKVMQERQSVFNNDKTIYCAMRDFINIVNNGLQVNKFSSSDMLIDIETRLTDSFTDFVNGIYNYFATKYQIKIVYRITDRNENKFTFKKYGRYKEFKKEDVENLLLFEMEQGFPAVVGENYFEKKAV